MARILMVADERSESRPLAAHLERRGHRISWTDDAWAALTSLASLSMVIVDADFYGADTVELVQTLRDGGLVLPLIVMMRRATERTILDAYASGVDDIVVEPYSVAVLTARVGALLRRAGYTAPIRCGDLSLRPGARIATRGDQELDLTRTEFDLLHAMARHAGRVCSRPWLLRAVWANPLAVSPRNVDVLVCSLRRKLGEDRRRPRYIQTVFGVGYRLRRP